MLNKIKSFIKNMTKKQKKIAIAALCVLLACVTVFAVLYSNGYSGIHNNKKPKDGQIKVACVGDSVTYGFGVSGWAKNNYPAQLRALLGDGYNVANFGHSGTTLSPKGDKPYVESRQYKKSIEYDADILVIMLGSNDTKPQNWASISDFTDYYEELIESYKKNNPDLRVIVCTTAKAFYTGGKTEGATSFDIQPSKVESIRNSIRVWAVVNGYEVADVYELTENHPEWFEADGVHPDKDGARAIAELIASKVKRGQ